MNKLVYKFGGSYLNNLKNWNKIYRLVLRKINKNRVIVVVSAIGRNNDPYSTDTLLKNGENLSELEKDSLIAIGEKYSSLKITNFLKSKGINVKCVLDNELGIYDDLSFKKDNYDNFFNNFDVLIVPGFICKDKDGYTRTLGRGGSDLSSLLITKGLELGDAYLNKDTGGVLSCNSPVISNKEIISKLSYDQAITYFSYTGEVVQIRALEYAKENNIKLHIMGLDSKKETIISNEENNSCIYGLVNIINKIYIFGKTDDYTFAVIQDFLREFKTIKYRIRVGFIELTVEDKYIEDILIGLHKRFLEG